MRRPWMCALLLGCGLLPLRASDGLAEALWLPAASPRLVLLARSWQGREMALAGEMAGPEEQRRRGAARLAALVDLPGATLLEIAATTRDGEVRRLLAAALATRLAGVPPGDLLHLGDASLSCLLLAQHPAEDVLADPQVRRQVGDWLRDRAAARDAAALVAARGSAEAWAATLVDALALVAGAEFQKADAASATAMAEALHAALEFTTRSQRSLTVYAGHLELAVKDWSDLLAARGVEGSADSDPEILGLIADLPRAEALAALLAKGVAAIRPLDQVMASAPRPRRRELETAARLLARRVSPALWRDCASSGLEDLDASDATARLTCLRRIADAIRRLKDDSGPLHLLAWTDDRDALIRSTALDFLVRLSDHRGDFRREWKMADDAAFPPGETAWRLRRSLARGEADERVAAMQLIASLSCQELVEEVAAQFLSASDMVVDTAIETLGHLEVTDAAAEALLRLAEDGRQNGPRRIKALELALKTGHRGSGRRLDVAARFRARLAALIHDPVDAVRRAATALGIRAGNREARTLAAQLLAGASADRLAALEALSGLGAGDLLKGQGDQGSLAALAAERLGDAEASVAARAALLFLDKLPSSRYRSDDADLANDQSLAGLIARQREAVVRRATTAEAGQAPCLALAVALSFLPRERVLALLATLPASESAVVWMEVIHQADDPVALLDAIIDLHPAGPLPDAVARTAFSTLQIACVFNRRLLDEQLASGDLTLLEHLQSRSDSNGSLETKTFTDRRGRRLVLEGRPRAQDGDQGDESSKTWTVTSAPADPPDDQRISAVVERLQRLRLTAELSAHRDLLVSILGHRPAPLAHLDATATRLDDLWRQLAARDAATRQAVVAWFNRQEKPSSWELQRLLRQKNPDLLPAVVAVLAAVTDKDYIDSTLLRWLSSLDIAAVAPFLPRLVAPAPLARSSEIRALVKKAGRLPVTTMLALLAARRRVEVPAAPWTEAEAVAAQLKTLDADTVLAMSDMLRAVRSGNPAIFDRLLPALLAAGDATAAAWLRSAIPAEAGLVAAYRAALSSPVPDVWLVGAAFALKEGRLEPAAFLDHLAGLPPEIIGLASAVASRYLAQSCATQDARLAPLIARTTARHLSAWVALCPPGDAVIAALTARVRDPATAELAAAALMLRLRDDREHWIAAIRTLAAAANGRLDHLPLR